MSNQQIAHLFRNVAAAYSIKNEKKYRFQIIAYQKAADAIENSNAEIKDLYREKALETVPGIGPSIKDHIEELIKTGSVKRFKWVFNKIPKALFPLLDVPSFGPKKAYKIVESFKLTNPETVIEDVENLAKKEKIASLPGFGEKSQSDILRAIVEYKEGKSKERRMTLPYASEIAKKVVDYLKKSKDAVSVEPLGSFRRMKPTIGDIDIAVGSNNPKALIDYFTKYPYKERVVEKGDVSASILVSGGHQVDLMIQPPESFGSLLQHFTGSKAHNIHLREYALKLGLSLSEYGIKKGKKLNKYSSEEEFYKAINMDWIPPEIREDKGEIELALAHKLPKLVEVSDLKGDLHIHSDYPIEPSHDLGRSSMQEFLKRASQLKYEYIGFSEHNPSVSKHTKKEIYDILARRKENIEHIKSSKFNVRIIKLLEVDILANGNLSIDNKSADLLDAMIVSIHSSFDMSKKEMTKRVLGALSHPKAKILAHPTGRMFNIRPGFELEWEEVFAFCKKHKKALEVNSWPSRLDLSDLLIKQAVQNNIKLAINTDSHAVNQLNMIKYGVAMARRGWAKKSDIVNTLPYTDFINWLKA